MQQPEKEKQTDVMVTMETKMVTFGGILLGILLLVIGVGASIKWVTYAGKFILPALCSGVVLSERRECGCQNNLDCTCRHCGYRRFANAIFHCLSYLKS